MFFATLPCGLSMMSVVVSIFNIYFVMTWEQKDHWKYESTYMGPSTFLQFIIIKLSLIHLWSLVGLIHFIEDIT